MNVDGGDNDDDGNDMLRFICFSNDQSNKN